jgi:Flp pilus assembly protein TadD
MFRSGMPRADRLLRHAAPALFLLGLVGCQQPQTPTAAQMAASDNKANADGVLNVADAAIAGNDPAMALKVSQSVLASDPTNLQALYHEGAAYYAVGRCEDAIAAYQVALRIDAASSGAQTGIGRCLLKTNAAQAEAAFAAAVQDDPNNAAALNDLGIARDLQGKYAAATQPYRQALLVQPGVLATEVNLGMSLALSGDSGDALQYLGPLATSADATPKIREDYALALVGAGRQDQARQVLSVDLPPDQVEKLLAAFTAAIQAPPPPPPPAAAPTTTTSTVTTITTAPLAGPAAAALTPLPVAPPAVAPPAIVPPASNAPSAAGNEILR